MSGTWIVVADSSRARFFSMENRSDPLQELEGMAHAEGRMRGQDEVSDRQGGLAGGHGEGGHPFEAPTDVKHHEAEVFARQIADKLEQGRVNHDYQKLILVAPPAFLGTLRQQLSTHVQEMVTESHDKHLVTETEPSIRQHIL